MQKMTTQMGLTEQATPFRTFFPACMISTPSLLLLSSRALKSGWVLSIDLDGTEGNHRLCWKVAGKPPYPQPTFPAVAVYVFYYGEFPSHRRAPL